MSKEGNDPNISTHSEEEEFQLSLSKKDEKSINFPYDEIGYSTINLISHDELPQDVKWSKPKISRDSKYIGVIASSIKDKYTKDILYIWKLNEEQNTFQFHVKTDHEEILTFDFITTKESEDKPCYTIAYVIITPYPAESIYYNIKSGHLVYKLPPYEKLLDAFDTYCSTYGRFLTVVTGKSAVVFDLLDALKLECVYEGDYQRVFNELLFNVSGTQLSIVEIRRHPKVQFTMKIPDINSYNEILACSIESERPYTNVYYVLKSGFYKIDVKQIKVNKIFSFDVDTEQTEAFISPDCKRVMTTDMSTIYFWEEVTNKDADDNSNNIGVIFRQAFNYITILFDHFQLLTVDDYRISMINFKDTLSDTQTNEDNKTEEEKNQEEVNQGNNETNIYLDTNMKQILSYKFSSDNKTLLTILDPNRAIIWDIQTGKIIRKWKNDAEMWYKTVEMTPDESDYTLISTKTTDNLIQLWDYSTGNEFAPLFGFNAYSVSFSSNGFFVAAGCVSGKDVATIWELNDLSSESVYSYSEDVKSVSVKMTNQILICVPEGSSPLLFYIEDSTLLYKIKDINLDFITKIEQSKDDTLLNILGYQDNVSKGYFFDLENCVILRTFDHCATMQFSSKNENLLVKIIKSKKSKDNTLIIYTIRNKELIPKNIQIDVEENFIFSDDLCVCSIVQSPNEKIFVLSNINDGKLIGEATYVEKSNTKYAVDLTPKNGRKLLLKRFGLNTINSI